MNFGYQKGVWLLNCTSPVFVWGACIVTVRSSRGLVAAAASGSELLPEENLSDSTQFAEGRL